MASDVRHSQKKIPIIVIIVVSPSLAFIQFEPICLLLHISLFLPSTSPDSWIWVSGDQITSNCNNIISQLLSWPPLVPFADPMTEGRLQTDILILISDKRSSPLLLAICYSNAPSFNSLPQRSNHQISMMANCMKGAHTALHHHHSLNWSRAFEDN